MSDSGQRQAVRRVAARRQVFYLFLFERQYGPQLSDLRINSRGGFYQMFPPYILNCAHLEHLKSGER